MRYIITILSILVLQSAYAQNHTYSRKVDSLLQKYENHQVEDSMATVLLNMLSFEIRDIDIEKSKKFAEEALRISKEIDFAKGVCFSYHNLSKFYYYRGKYDTCIELNLKVGEIASKHGFKKLLARSYNNIAVYYDHLGNLEEAINYSMKSLKIHEELEDYYGVAAVYNELGSVYFQQNMYNEAINHFKLAMKYDRMVDDESGLGYDFGNIGASFKHAGEPDSAAYYLKKSIEIRRKLQEYHSLSIVLGNLGNIYLSQRKVQEADTLFNEALQLALKIDDRDVISYMNVSLSKLNLEHTKDYDAALDYAKKAYEVSKEIKSLQRQREALGLLSLVYEKLGKYKEALEYKKNSDRLNDSLLNQKNSTLLAEMEKKYETEKKELEITNLQQEQLLSVEKNKRKNILIYSALLMLIVLGLLIYFIYNKLKITRAQKQVIESQHQEIQDSINYAKRIQNALLTTDEYWEQISKDYFIYFKPRDIVSGDFFWAYHTDDGKAVWVSADCTGHGVPGAFMSMLGVGFLSEIVVEAGITQANQVLDRLRDKIINSLKSKDVDVNRNDGMDIAICVWDKNNNVLQYAGAYNPLIHISNKKINYVRADRQPIGVLNVNETPFTMEEIQLQKGDILYTFSDGYLDQFGGSQNKKFGSRRFKELLLRISDKPMSEQYNIIDNEFNSWKGDEEQIDDICIVAVRV